LAAGKRKRASRSRGPGPGPRRAAAPQREVGARAGQAAGVRGVGAAVIRWAVVAFFALPVGWLLGILELEPVSVVQFLAVIAAIGFVFEFLQPRLGGSGEKG
jgi:hypothetical protein